MHTSTLLGSVLLLLGTVTLIVAVFRAMGHDFSFGVCTSCGCYPCSAWR